MAKPRIVVCHPLPDTALEPLRAVAEVVVAPDPDPHARGVLLHLVAGADGLLTLLTDTVDAELLDAAGPRCRVVANVAVGYDNIDLAAAAERGVVVTNTPGVLTDATADHTMALLLAAARRLPEAQAYARAGRWTSFRYDLLLGMELRGATLGIVGYGRIGRAVAERARAFGMDVLAAGHRPPGDYPPEPGVRRVDRDELLASADVVSLHCPLTPDTRRWMDRAALAAMRDTALLVNVARGPVVDTDALVDALQSGAIAGAALDVTDPEPLPADHPLYALERCLVVPHLGSATTATRVRMAELAVANVAAVLEGRPAPNPVRP